MPLPLINVVSNAYFDNSWKSLPQFLELMVSQAVLGCTVALGVFTQPFCRVEENSDAIDFYHTLLDRLGPQNQNQVRVCSLTSLLDILGSFPGSISTWLTMRRELIALRHLRGICEAIDTPRMLL